MYEEDKRALGPNKLSDLQSENQEIKIENLGLNTVLPKQSQSFFAT